TAVVGSTVVAATTVTGVAVLDDALSACALDARSAHHRRSAVTPTAPTSRARRIDAEASRAWDRPMAPLLPAAVAAKRRGPGRPGQTVGGREGGAARTADPGSGVRAGDDLLQAPREAGPDRRPRVARLHEVVRRLDETPAERPVLEQRQARVGEALGTVRDQQ